MSELDDTIKNAADELNSYMAQEQVAFNLWGSTSIWHFIARRRRKEEYNTLCKVVIGLKKDLSSLELEQRILEAAKTESNKNVERKNNRTGSNFLSA